MIGGKARRELATATAYATRLLYALCAKHWPGNAVEPLPDLLGVLTQIDHVTAELPRSDDLCVLIEIQRQGKLNVFKFRRGGTIFTIETYGTLADNVKEWKQQAGLI